MKYILFIIVDGALVLGGSITAANTDLPVVGGNLYVPIAIFVTSIIATAGFVWAVSRKVNNMDNRIERNKRVVDEVDGKVDQCLKAIKELKTMMSNPQ